MSKEANERALETQTVERIPLPDMETKLESFARRSFSLIERDILDRNYGDVLRTIDSLTARIKKRIDMIRDIEEGPLRSNRRYSDEQIKQEF